MVVWILTKVQMKQKVVLDNKMMMSPTWVGSLDNNEDEIK